MTLEFDAPPVATPKGGVPLATAPDPGEPVSEEAPRRRVSAGFVLFASQLAGALQAARNAFGHDLARGEYLEGILKSALRDILPTGYNLFSGQIISTTSISRQQDLVVVDSKNVSSLLRSEDLGIVPIESVSGTIEVKTSLTKKTVEEAVRNVESVKALVKDRPPTATGTPAMPFGGVVGYASRPQFLSIAQSYVNACRHIPNRDHRPDALFVLGGGTVMPGRRVGDDNASSIALCYWNDFEAESQLVFAEEDEDDADDNTRPTAIFIHRLTQHLTAYTPPPIDITKYGKVGRGDWNFRLFEPLPTSKEH